jgi:hypothetical protein
MKVLISIHRSETKIEKEMKIYATNPGTNKSMKTKA